MASRIAGDVYLMGEKVEPGTWLAHFAAPISWGWILAALVPYMIMVGSQTSTSRINDTRQGRTIHAGWNQGMAVFSTWGAYSMRTLLFNPSQFVAADDPSTIQWAQ